MSTNVKHIFIRFDNNSLIRIKGAFSISNMIKILGKIMPEISTSDVEDVVTSEEEEEEVVTSSTMKKPGKKRSTGQKTTKRAVAIRNRVRTSRQEKKEEEKSLSEEEVESFSEEESSSLKMFPKKKATVRKVSETDDEKESIRVDVDPMIGQLAVPMCDYNMFYDVFEQVPEHQRALIVETWNKFGYIYIPSFGTSDLYLLSFPRIMGKNPEDVTYDQSITGEHDIPTCSCPSYQYSNKKWMDCTQDRQRLGGCKHIFFVLDILRIPHGYFKWEEKKNHQ